MILEMHRKKSFLRVSFVGRWWGERNVSKK
jgi:hypothetical protein